MQTISGAEPLPFDNQSDEHFMREALREAKKAFQLGEVPVGAVVVREGRVVGRASNQVELLKDATAHAEMIALSQAQAEAGDWRLTDCTLYVTKEPCPMCAGAIIHTRLKRVVFGVQDAKAGGLGGAVDLMKLPGINHTCEVVSGMEQEKSLQLLQEFFRMRRDENRKNVG